MGGDGLETTGAPRSGWRLALAWVKAAVSVGLLWVLFTAYDLGDSISRIAAIDQWSLAFAALAIPASVLLVTLRWRIVLASLGEQIAPGPVFAMVMIGLFFNQVLPSNLGGDAMRIWRLCRRGVRAGHAVGSVMLDRVVAMVGLALLVLATLPLAAGLIADTTILAAFGLFILAVVVGLAVLLGLDRVILMARPVLPARLVGALSALAVDSRTVLLDRRRTAGIVALSVCNQLLIVLLIAVLARGLGIRAEPLSFLVLIPPVLLATMLPLSFAGWGVREGAMVALLGAVGVAPGEALALSVAFGLLILLGSLPGGVVWLATDSRSGGPPGKFPPR